MRFRKILIASLCAASVACQGEESLLIDEALPPAKGWSLVGFALAPVRFMQFPNVESDVHGLGIGLTAGHNRQVNGIDIAAFANWAEGEINGIACSGIANSCGGATFAIHLAPVVNYSSGRLNGMQISTVNSAYGVNGFQAGLVNYMLEGGGFQIGLFNVAETFRGLQIGLANMAMNCSGVQMGICNIIGESPLTACVFFNAWF